MLNYSWSEWKLKIIKLRLTCLTYKGLGKYMESKMWEGKTK